MFRRILACLALLSGLAVIGAPANASLGEQLACETGISAKASDSATQDCRAREQRQIRRFAATPVIARQLAPRPRYLAPSPVITGVDRALE